MADKPTYHADRAPCSTCPYRLDTPPGVWAAEEYEKLRAYDKETWEQPMALFMCHSGDATSKLCRGWIDCHGYELMGLRICVIEGRAPETILEDTAGVPVYETGNAAAAAGIAGIEAASPESIASAERLVRKRGRR